MSDWYGSFGGGGSSSRSSNNEEFQEEDVWSTLRDQGDMGCNITERPDVESRQIPTVARMIPRADREKQLEPDEAKMGRQSAPVGIPDWSKIYGKNKVGMEAPPDGDYGKEDEDDDENSLMTMPPHEWIAVKEAKSKKTASSVCEGAGRTLKGRDLRKVRHAVLSRTGFLEF
ncbi:uncharacterized protein LOC124940427 [Impatiens glandulifera]|uniref:uncharacterized protein LOC124940427 n=1 Tax=Impatiens glandulifera TaxID=253017 RepID=UPI001FB0DDD7|nr:uncharacterized protein LOC124940427 [Impatiens glandulifera]